MVELIRSLGNVQTLYWPTLHSSCGLQDSPVLMSLSVLLIFNLPLIPRRSALSSLPRTDLHVLILAIAWISLTLWPLHLLMTRNCAVKRYLFSQRHRHRSRRMIIMIRIQQYVYLYLETPKPHTNFPSTVFCNCSVFCAYTAFSNWLVTLYQTPFKGLMTQTDLAWVEPKYCTLHPTSRSLDRKLMKLL
jgi:hypothetical protein